MTFSRNEYKVLILMKQYEAVSEMKSLSINKLSELTKLSVSKIRVSISKFKEQGYVVDGAFQHNAKTYFISEKGINKVKSLL